MQKKQTKLLFYLSILTALLTVGVFIFFFRIIKNKNEHTMAVQATLEEKIIKKENLKNLEKKITEIQATKKEINSYFVDPAEIDSFISYLEKLGTSGGTELDVKDVSIATSDKNFISVKVSAKGSFVDVMRTISLLENMPYKTHITTIFLNKGTKSTSVGEPGKEKTINTTFWQADVSFKILSSS